MRFLLSTLLIPVLLSCSTPETRTVDSDIVPVIDGEFWRIGEIQDLDSLNGPDLSRQHVVDHGFVQDEQGQWHLWACMRGTRAGRIFYGWTGNSLTDKVLWDPDGVVARADSSWGENARQGAEQMQAPFFLKENGTYYCFYNSAGIRIMTSEDGTSFSRPAFSDGSNMLYEKGGRDVMVMKEDSLYYAYSTISTAAADGWLRGFVIVRTSPDLKRWSDYVIVSEGGRAGNGPVSAESPFVQKYNDHYYLFRSSSMTGTTFVYRSENPYNFGVNDDSKLIGELPVWAPEILEVDGEWFISDIDDFKGVKLARLKWENKAE